MQSSISTKAGQVIRRLRHISASAAAHSRTGGQHLEIVEDVDLFESSRVAKLARVKGPMRVGEMDRFARDRRCAGESGSARLGGFFAASMRVRGARLRRVLRSIIPCLRAQSDLAALH